MQTIPILCNWWIRCSFEGWMSSCIKRFVSACGWWGCMQPCMHARLHAAPPCMYACIGLHVSCMRTCVQSMHATLCVSMRMHAIGNVLHYNKTFSNGCLGSRIDEGRSEMRYALWIADFSEPSDFWTHMALLGLPDSTSVSVSFDFFIKYTARASVVCMIT